MHPTRARRRGNQRRLAPDRLDGGLTMKNREFGLANAKAANMANVLHLLYCGSFAILAALALAKRESEK